ncbi:hypothetical protein SRDD_08620 [Serratia sp. DD3]|nr:hypothetical protein SRDD_08620 [Serratia sp. DD3]
MLMALTLRLTLTQITLELTRSLASMLTLIAMLLRSPQVRCLPLTFMIILFLLSTVHYLKK